MIQGSINEFNDQPADKRMALEGKALAGFSVVRSEVVQSSVADAVAVAVAASEIRLNRLSEASAMDQLSTVANMDDVDLKLAAELKFSGLSLKRLMRKCASRKKQRKLLDDHRFTWHEGLFPNYLNG